MAKLRLAIVFCTLVCVSACASVNPASPDLTPTESEAESSVQAAWPAFPSDGIQPWEQLDSAGNVVLGRSASAFNGDAQFVPGVERFLDSAAGEQGDALRLQSANATAWAVYRIPLGGDQPGTISVDANLLGADSSYYVGIADYATAAWDWRGPFSEAQITLAVHEMDATSNLGNVFAALVVESGRAIDVVGVAVQPLEIDSTVPPAPTGFTATPAHGGLELRWLGVDAADLAGYRVYHSFSPFSAAQNNGTVAVEYLEGTTRMLLKVAQRLTFVAVSTVDRSGNESPLSTVLCVFPLAAQPAQLELGLDSASVQRNEPAELQVGGAALYDADLDGDGTFEVIDATASELGLDTSAPGILRPRVRAKQADGTAIAMGSVSLIISGNSRPSAHALVAPQSGPAPLEVTFTASGEDSDGSIVEFAWDTDGDGIYDITNPPATPTLDATYNTPGLYNAKLRVTDDQGGWDVDTLALRVLVNPDNAAPEITAIAASPALVEPSTPVNFTAAATDPEGTALTYSWDFDNDGTEDSTEQNPQQSFLTTATHNVRLTVTDEDGIASEAGVTVVVLNDPTNVPPAITELDVSPSGGFAPLVVDFDALASDPDGMIASYAWDIDNDGTFEHTGPDASFDSTYFTAGHYTAHLRVTDDDGDTSSAFVGISVNFNLPPVARLTVNRAVALKPHVGGESWAIRGDADSSYDPDGGSVDYSWDFDSDGVYEYENAPADQVHHYSAPGIYTLRLAVEDNEGSITEATQQVKVLQLGQQVIVDDPAEDEGQRSAVAEVSGRALVVYLNVTDMRLYWTHAQDADALSWSAPQQITGTNNIDGGLGVLQLGDGEVGVAFHDDTGGDLRWVTFDHYSPIYNHTPIDSTNDVGHELSLIALNGIPAIAYYDSTAGDVKFCRASTPDGNVWGTPVIIEDGNDVGRWLSLAEVDDVPAVAFYSSPGENLLYKRALDGIGSSWPTGAQVIDLTGDAGRFCRLARIGSGELYGVAYWNSTDQQTYFSTSTDLGVNWSPRITVFEAGGSEGHCGLLHMSGGGLITGQVGGQMMITAPEGFTSPLILGAGDFVFDSGADTGELPAAALVAGRPVITYYDAANGALKAAVGRY